MPECLTPGLGAWNDPTGLLTFEEFLQSEHSGPVPSLTDRGANAMVFDRYLDHLESKSAGRLLLLDVKFNQTHFGDGWFCNVGGLPLAVQKMYARGPIVILRRRNLVMAQVSAMVAWETGLWHLQSSIEPIPDPRPAAIQSSVRLDPQSVCRHVELLDAQCRAVEGWFLNPAYKVAYVWYEDLFDSPTGACNAAELDRVARFLGLDGGNPWKSDFKKIGGEGLADSVANAAEIQAVFQGTKYEGMAA